MKSASSPVVPRSIERAKRIAKQLHEIYPQHLLSTCQEVTARLFFHRDWHALNESLKVGSAAGPFDHELTEEGLKERRRAQRGIVCRELGGVDPETKAPPPKDYVHNKDTTNLILDAVIGSASPHSVRRLEASFTRWKQRLAAEAITEIGPTLEKVPVNYPVTDILTLCPGEWLASMPQNLARWWRVNISHQPTVADSLAGFKLDPNRRISLLKFGGYWGELCMHYAETIDWTMAMGTAYLLAERYATILVHKDRGFLDLAPKLVKCSNEDFDRLIEPFFDQQTRAATFFFQVYPRDDFNDAYAAQPLAFAKNAGECISILSTPKSKRGTWKR